MSLLCCSCVKLKWIIHLSCYYKSHIWTCHFHNEIEQMVKCSKRKNHCPVVRIILQSSVCKRLNRIESKMVGMITVDILDVPLTKNDLALLYCPLIAVLAGLYFLHIKGACQYCHYIARLELRRTRKCKKDSTFLNCAPAMSWPWTHQQQRHRCCCLHALLS